MKNKTKIFAVFCMIAVFALTMCVSAFAATPTEYAYKYTINYFGGQTFSSSDELPTINAVGVDMTVVFEGKSVETVTGITSITGSTTVTFDGDSSGTFYNDGYGDGYGYNLDGISGGSASGYALDDVTMIIYTDEPIIIEPFNTPYATVIVEDSGSPVVAGVFGVFTSMTSFIIGGINLVQPVFYANGGLTLLGSLAVIALAVGVAFLIIGVIQKFLALRG